MSSSALVVMFFAMVLIWGGLIFSTLHLIKNPDIDISKISDDL